MRGPSVVVVAQKNLSLGMAITIANATLGECRAKGAKSAVVVLDRSGQILVALRDEEAPPNTVEMARRKVALGEERLFESCTGAVFSGKVLREAPPVGRAKSVIVEVAGRAHQTGEARFRFDDDDPLREGFSRGH